MSNKDTKLTVNGVLTVGIKNITVLHNESGQDYIYITFDGPTPYPEMEAENPGEYPPVLTLNCRKGYAEELLEKMWLSATEVVNIP